MQPERLASLVTAAREGDGQAREELIAFHRSFVHRTASRVAGRVLDPNNDDEISVALLAFNEAIDKYAARQGASFLTYAVSVIRHRLLDHFRKEARHRPVRSLQAGEEPDPELAPAEVREAWARYEAEQEAAQTAHEIDILCAELARYGITLADLAGSSPKHRDTKAVLLRVVRGLLDRPDLVEMFRRTRQLPLKELEQTLGVSRKVLESGRRYIVAVAVVMLHPELQRIRAHIRIPELGG